VALKNSFQIELAWNETHTQHLKSIFIRLLLTFPSILLLFIEKVIFFYIALFCSMLIGNLHFCFDQNIEILLASTMHFSGDANSFC
jgi:hypothetical protein